MRGSIFPTMTAHVHVVVVVVVATVVAAFVLAGATFAHDVKTAQNDQQPTEFNSMLAAVVQKTMDHLAEYKPIKRAVKLLREELKSQDVQNNSKSPDQKKKGKANKEEWSDKVSDLLNTVDTFFGDQPEPSARVRNKEAGDIADMFAEFQLFKMDLKRFRVDYKRIIRIAGYILELMSRRPKLRTHVAESISLMLNLPANIRLEEPLNILGQSMAMWNTPMGQKLVKPVLDKMLTNLRKSNFDINVVKPSVDMLLITLLGENYQKQLQPTVDIIFRLVDRGIKLLQMSGFENLLMNLDPSRILRTVQNTYVEVFLDLIEPLHDVLKSSDRVQAGLENVIDVTRRYRNIPGTMDSRFRRGDFNDPVAKVKSILTQLERSNVEMEESREAIIGFHAYPLHHQLQAIDAIKMLLVSLEVGQRALKDFWPLRGFLRAHPIVKGQELLSGDLGQLKELAKRAIDKTHKIQVLIDDVQNMESVFEIKKIYDDVRNILTGYPQMRMIVILMDLVKGELDKIKEIAYNG